MFIISLRALARVRWRTDERRVIAERRGARWRTVRLVFCSKESLTKARWCAGEVRENSERCRQLLAAGRLLTRSRERAGERRAFCERLQAFSQTEIERFLKNNHRRDDTWLTCCVFCTFVFGFLYSIKCLSAIGRSKYRGVDLMSHTNAQEHNKLT